MRKSINLTVLFAALLMSFTFNSCDKEENLDPQSQLNEQEKITLLFMYEEEKMARDVYAYLDGLYDMNIFKNISGSEEKHMGFVGEILDKYEVVYDFPTEAGVFEDSDIQGLYDALTTQGTPSLIDALIVGATIEDVDINDLNNAVAATDKVDIISMYETLTCGSRNHMRGFVGQLEDRDGVYSPQYISQDLYDEILAGSHESCSE